MLTKGEKGFGYLVCGIVEEKLCSPQVDGDAFWKLVVLNAPLRQNQEHEKKHKKRWPIPQNPVNNAKSKQAVIVVNTSLFAI